MRTKIRQAGRHDPRGAKRRWAWRCLQAGDEHEALDRLRDVVRADLPEVAEVARDVVVDRRALNLPEELILGDASRRGVWLPSDNLRGLPSQR
jgi:hypothetical protein